METTKEDKPKKRPERPRIFRCVQDPPDLPTAVTLSSKRLQACGSYDTPLIRHVYAEVRRFDDSLPVAATSGGTGGAEQEATLSSGVWSVTFTGLVDTPTSDSFYRLKVRFMEDGN